jgi:3-deoxy-7-phosphoheptulonate synthase
MSEKPFITPQDLKKALPLTPEVEAFVATSREKIRAILKGHDSRLLLLTGPCSIHDVKGALLYADRLKELSKQVSSQFLVVMRAYIEKPRTSLGWKGLLHDPNLDGTDSLEQGLHITRKLFLELAEKGIPTACEFLDPLTAAYNGDLISWGCIGARTSASQVHRQIASMLPMPIAFKNSTDGNIEIAVNGCLYASQPHKFLALQNAGHLSLKQSTGNPDTHIVLRGAEDKPNYDAQSVQTALQLLTKADLPRRLIIDCSHGNSRKQHEQQMIVFRSVMEQVRSGTREIRGLMLESYLKAGHQPHHGKTEELQYDISITDPCLSFEETEALILSEAK